MQIRESTVSPTPTAARMPDIGGQSHGHAANGYAAQAIRLERALGWVLWIGLAIVLVMLSL